MLIIENNQTYFVCEIHGNVEVGRKRTVSNGCPKCNIERARLNNLKLKKNAYIRKYSNEYNIKFNDEENIAILECKEHKTKTEVSLNKSVTDLRKYFCDECKTKSNHLSYEKASEKIKKYNLGSERQYREWYKKTKPHDLPGHPDRVYKNKGFISFSDFLGYKKKASSKNEMLIIEFFTKNGINYIKDKKFNDCWYKKILEFDFYLPEYNLVIEYDGEQHFVANNLCGGEYGLKINKLRDSIKNSFCEIFNINIERIKYTTDVTDSLLMGLVSKYKKL